MAEEAKEEVFISQYEFAKTIEKLPNLFSQFKFKTVVNKFETVIKEVLRSKYDSVYLDFDNCSVSERNKLRSAYKRLEIKMRKNSNNKKDLSHGLPTDKAFISSDAYKTIVVCPPVPPAHERYIHMIFIFNNIFVLYSKSIMMDKQEHLNGIG